MDSLIEEVLPISEKVETISTLDREIGRLEGRVESLEKSVERLEVSVNGIIRILEFARKGIKLVYAGILMIGLDGVIRLVKTLLNISGQG